MGTTVKKTSYKVKKMVEQEVEEGVITITMSQKDASILRFVLGEIGGDPRGPRRATDTLFEELGRAGVDPATDVRHARGTMYIEAK